MEILKTENVSINFGGLKAVEDVCMTINENELVALIGPNGAGKTTVFNLLTGVYKPTSGSIYISNKNTLKLQTHNIVKLGISRTFQNIRLFKNLTVIDNIKIAYNLSTDYSIWDALFRSKKFRDVEKQKRKDAIELLSIFDMQDLADYEADSLSYGQQRKLEIARALATNPKILLLDEPAAGMNPQETAELMNIIKKIRDKFNIAILLIEHDMNLVMGICERIYVLNFGRMIAQGTPDEIQNNEQVIKAYLGE